MTLKGMLYKIKHEFVCCRYITNAEKDDSWRICIDNCVINKITFHTPRIDFPYLRLDDMLDLMARA